MNHKKTISIFIISFIIPVLLAYCALKFDLIPSNTVNHGEFLQAEIKLENWPSIEPKAWSIAMVQQNNCAKLCQQYKQQLQNLYVALGKNQHKVDLVLLTDAQQVESGFKNYPQPNSALAPSMVYLIDHMGLVVLRYELTENPDENRLIYKGVLKDLKKLLNYARSA